MTTTAEVRLWGSPIGTVSISDGDSFARFEYDASFAQSGIQLSPLVMPLSRQVYSFPQLPLESFHGLPGLLADSLPDRFGNAVINSWLESQGRPRNSLDAVERLCYTGTRGMGALEYIPALGPKPQDSDMLHVAELVELASNILNQRESLSYSAEDHGMEQIIQVGTSAGGARAKAVIAWNEETNEVRSGQAAIKPGFSHWLLKFDGIIGNGDKEGADSEGYTLIEYAYHLMARAAGIAMAECRLYEEGHRHHFMTRRFDRVQGTNEKLHMQTLGALAHFDFNAAREHSYEEAVTVAYRIGLGQAEAEEIFRRMVFNVCASNNDDHVKNTAFLMDRTGAWSLAPAYDITYAYNPSGLWTSSHQMTINGKSIDITCNDCLQAARSMNIKTAKAKRIIDEVSCAVARWLEFAETAHMPEERAITLQRAFVQLV